MAGVVTHHQMIVMVVAVAAVVSVVEECQDVQIIEVCLMGYVLSTLEYMLYLFLCSDIFCCISVLVTGLPHSASWQDLKVSRCL